MEADVNAAQKAPWTARVALFFCVFLPFALGQYMHALLRNVNAVLVPHLVAAFSLNAGQLGLLTSTFFFSVVVSQLPISAALERYGPHRVQLVLLMVAALGTVLFACGQTFAHLVVARAVIGFGVGGTLMTAVKAVSAKVAPEKLPSSVGFLIAFGGLGSASATLPMRPLLQHTDWRGLFLLLAGLTAGVALLAWLVRPRAPRPQNPKLPSLQALLEVCRNPAFRKTTMVVLVSHNIYWGVQGLWIGRWLSDVARFPESAVAYLLYLSMAAVIFGAVGVGMITDVAAVGVAGFVLVQGVIVFNYAPSFQLLSVLFTLVGTITGIEYTIVQQSMPRELTGAASSCLNMLIFMGAFLVQAGFGQIVGLWSPDGAGRYPAVAYQVAFGALVLLQLPGLVCYALQRRPVKCRINMLIVEQEYETSTIRQAR
jgi:predicted MFS family arabinose efflux permease